MCARGNNAAVKEKVQKWKKQVLILSIQVVFLLQGSLTGMSTPNPKRTTVGSLASWLMAYTMMQVHVAHSARPCSCSCNIPLWQHCILLKYGICLDCIICYITTVNLTCAHHSHHLVKLVSVFGRDYYQFQECYKITQVWVKEVASSNRGHCMCSTLHMLGTSAFWSMSIFVPSAYSLTRLVEDLYAHTSCCGLS